MQRACHTQEGQKTPKLVNSYEELFLQARSLECKFVLAGGLTLEYAASTRYCGVMRTVGRSFYRSSLSFILPRNSSMIPDMDRATLLLRSKDIIPTLDDYVNRNGNCGRKPSTSLTFRRLQGFFCFAFGAVIILFAAMLLKPTRRD